MHHIRSCWKTNSTKSLNFWKSWFLTFERVDFSTNSNMVSKLEVLCSRLNNPNCWIASIWHALFIEPTQGESNKCIKILLALLSLAYAFERIGFLTTSNMVSKLEVVCSIPKNLIVELQVFDMHGAKSQHLCESNKCTKVLLTLLPPA